MSKLEDYTVIDDNGLHWEWDGTRIFCIEAEEEINEMGEDSSQNGYAANTWVEALQQLIDGGYIERSIK